MGAQGLGDAQVQLLPLVQAYGVVDQVACDDVLEAQCADALAGEEQVSLHELAQYRIVNAASDESLQQPGRDDVAYDSGHLNELALGAVESVHARLEQLAEPCRIGGNAARLPLRPTALRGVAELLQE